MFQTEFDSIEREVRGLTRTQRLATTNSTFQAIKPTRRELEELNRKLDEKTVQLSEVKSLLTGRKDLLEISNRSVQGLKVVLASKEEITQQLIKVLKTVQDKLKTKLAMLRVSKDNFMNEKTEVSERSAGGGVVEDTRAMDLAKWPQMATSTTKLTFFHSIRLVRLVRSLLH